MQIRPIREEELESSLYLASQAFFNGQREIDRFLPPDRSNVAGFGVWDEAGLQAQVIVLPFQVHMGPRVTLPMGGIAGVCCLPASRGKGYAGKCLRYSLERMREANQVVSMLYPFSWEYYRQFGWEWIGVTRTYTVESRSLPSSPESDYVRAARPSDREKVIKCYTQFACRYRGLLARTQPHWDSILNDTPSHYTYTYLYERDGEVEGYLTIRENETAETRLREFITLTSRAMAGLLGMLRRYDMQIEKFSWNAADNDLLWHRYYHWAIQTSIKPSVQARVVDVAGALQRWQPDHEKHAQLTLKIADDKAPWNQGVWLIVYEGGQVSVQQTRENPQVEMDIQAFSQAFFGTPDLCRLRAAQRLIVHEESGFHALTELLAGPPAWINDSF
jgi:predicted acetyltransferase